ncbi:glycosyltransferase family protein [Arcicella rigui]|uniref:Alg9-like mannosyltransferase family protein n=1 Tax=Arcicella rigui TaxID=797020 RepID=A0ABU5QAR9_9BACT|nr:hypothetical protein [Arcicella rigui]MEA5139677.1 hypothetical protein [Arcicella rigui]
MQKYLDSLNLKKIIFIGLFFRLLAIVFSKGYAFTDDHYEVVEMAQNLLDKIDSPFTKDFLVNGEAYLFSLIYPYIHYIIFGVCEWFGSYNPETKMFFARVFNGLFSLLSIYYGYKLTERLSNRTNDAKIVALLLATFWVFPFMSVRNLREFVCIPPLLMGCYFAVKKPLDQKSVLLAAWWFVISFVFRYQIIFVPFSVGLFWLLSKANWQKAILFGLAFIGFYFLTQGLFDYVYWGNPIASIKAYFTFNANSKNIEIYPNGPWHRYIGTIAGLLLAFPSLMFFVGYFKTFTQSPNRRMLFLASLFFFVFHSYYPNKQERFILPFVPFILILGVIGFRDIYEAFQDKKWFRKTTNFLVSWFIVLNTILLCVLSVTYTKRSRVESMNYFREKGDLKNFVIQNFQASQPVALFYLHKRLDYYEIDTPEKLADLPNELKTGKKIYPNYLIMVGNSDLEARLELMKKVFPKLKHETDIEPSFIDNIAYVLNPSHNHNETWFIYRIEK